MYKMTKGTVPIIGVGGVGSGRDAYEKLKAGASLIQVYSMMVYEGPGVVSRIRKELADILVENGHKSVEDVVGADQEDIYWSRREETVRRRMIDSEKMKRRLLTCELLNYLFHDVMDNEYGKAKYTGDREHRQS
eukprot:49511_1